MTENILSISFETSDDAFKSKNAKRRMKEELKKSYNLLEDKDDFLLIPNDTTGYFTRFLNDTFKFDIEKISDLNYLVKIIIDEEKQKELEMEKEKELKKQQIRNKLNEMKSIRSNQTGRKIKEMRKDLGDDMVKKFLEAQRSMGGQAIPDPSEIMKNKDKYFKQFEEYQKMIKDMKEKNPQMATMLQGNPYHNYANAVSDKLNIPLD